MLQQLTGIPLLFGISLNTKQLLKTGKVQYVISSLNTSVMSIISHFTNT